MASQVTGKEEPVFPGMLEYVGERMQELLLQ